MSKLQLGIIFGGMSAEHEVSIESAKQVIAHVNLDKYDVIPIGIDKEGVWHLFTLEKFHEMFQAHLPSLDSLSEKFNLQDLKKLIDVAFPILHGPFGEDGTVQGLLKLMQVPFVGADVLGSAVGMDKDVMKRLFRDAKIPIADFLVFHDHETIDSDSIVAALGLPLFVKPANMGSSLGISKVKQLSELDKAIEKAFEYDQKIVIEAYISGRELECSILGNFDVQASLPGEVIPMDEFYTYEAKYYDRGGALFHFPAKLDEEVTRSVQDASIQAYRAICCQGMARVDCFLSDEGEVIVNEINTIPGFTPLSPYPKLWEVSGLSYSDLIEELVSLALNPKRSSIGFPTSLK